MTPSTIQPAATSSVLSALLSPSPARTGGDAAAVFTLALPFAQGATDPLAATALAATIDVTPRPIATALPSPLAMPLALPDATAPLVAGDGSARHEDADTGNELPAPADDLPLDPALDPALAWIALAPPIPVATPVPVSTPNDPPATPRVDDPSVAIPSPPVFPPVVNVAAQPAADPAGADDAAKPPADPTSAAIQVGPASVITQAVTTTALTPLAPLPSTAPVTVPVIVPALTSADRPAAAPGAAARPADAPAITVEPRASQPTVAASPAPDSGAARHVTGSARLAQAAPAQATAPRVTPVATPMATPARFQPQPTAATPVESRTVPTRVEPDPVAPLATIAPPMSDAVAEPVSTPVPLSASAVASSPPTDAAALAAPAVRPSAAPTIVLPLTPMPQPIAAATRQVEAAAPLVAAIQPSVAFLRQTRPIPTVAPTTAAVATTPIVALSAAAAVVPAAVTPMAAPIRDIVPADQTTTPPLPAPTALPASPEPVAKPAAQAFGAAIHAAALRPAEPRAFAAVPPTDTPPAPPIDTAPQQAPLDPASMSVVPLSAANDVRPAPAVGSIVQAPLDVTQRQWPQNMIARIEGLRDMANAADTSIRLIPDALGRIDVSMRSEGDTVHIEFAAEQAATRQLLQDAAPRLHAAAEERGLKLGETRVAAAADPSTQNGTGGNNTGGNAGQQGNAPGTGSAGAGAQQQQAQHQQQREAARSGPNRAPRSTHTTTADSDAADQAGGRIA